MACPPYCPQGGSGGAIGTQGAPGSPINTGIAGDPLNVDVTSTMVFASPGNQGPSGGHRGFDITPDIITTDSTPADGGIGSLLSFEALLWQNKPVPGQTSENPIIPAGGLKGSKLAKPEDPCNGSQQTIKNSQLPSRTGDINSDSNTFYYSMMGSGYSQTQANGLSTEMTLADIAGSGDSSEWTNDGNDLPTSIENAVKSITASEWQNDTPEDIANTILNDVLGANMIQGYPLGPGSLSSSLISVLNQLAQEIENGNEGNIDWISFSDYLAAQADADAAAMQANYLQQHSPSGNPCSDINTAVNGLNESQFNFQQEANKALKKLDKNIKPPAGGGTNCDNIDPYDTSGDADTIPDLDGETNSQTHKKFPPGIKEAILSAAKKYGVNPMLLYSIGMQESWLGTHRLYDQTTGTGDNGNGLGLWQMDKNYNPLKLSASDLNRIKNDVQFAAEMAAKFLAQQLKKYNGDVKKTIRSYNGGINNPKTATYLKHVCDFMQNGDPTGAQAIRGYIAGHGPQTPPSAAPGFSLLPDMGVSMIGNASASHFSEILPPLSASLLG